MVRDTSWQHCYDVARNEHGKSDHEAVALADIAREKMRYAGFDPSQPRAPAGSEEGGQWIEAGGYHVQVDQQGIIRKGGHVGLHGKHHTEAHGFVPPPQPVEPVSTPQSPPAAGSIEAIAKAYSGAAGASEEELNGIYSMIDGLGKADALKASEAVGMVGMGSKSAADIKVAVKQRIAARKGASVRAGLTERQSIKQPQAAPPQAVPQVQATTPASPIDDALGKWLDKEGVQRINADAIDPSAAAAALGVSPADIEAAGKRLATVAKTTAPKPGMKSPDELAKALKPKQPRRPAGHTIEGRFSAANLPKQGDTISYYDGEGGVSKEEIHGQVLEVRPGGNSPIRVLSRTGRPIWIEPEAARPYTSPQKPQANPQTVGAAKTIADLYGGAGTTSESVESLRAKATQALQGLGKADLDAAWKAMGMSSSGTAEQLRQKIMEAIILRHGTRHRTNYEAESPDRYTDGRAMRQHHGKSVAHAVSRLEALAERTDADEDEIEGTVEGIARQFSKAELREVCEAFGVKAVGTKGLMIERILDKLSAERE